MTRKDWGNEVSQRLRRLRKCEQNLLFPVLALLLIAGCEKRDYAKEEAEALERNRAATAERKAQLYGRDPASLARSAREAEETRLDADRREACKRLAQETRDCEAGKPCKQASISDVQQCAAHLQYAGLDRNPY